MLHQTIDGVTLYDIGTSFSGSRCLGIDIAPGTNLFKVGDEELPLLNGWRTVSASTLPFCESKKVMPKKIEGESTSDFLARLKDHSAKIAALPRWDISVRSDSDDEDFLILDQLQRLNRMSMEDFDSLLAHAKVPFYLPHTGAMPETDFEIFRDAVEKDPFLSTDIRPQTHPGGNMGVWDPEKLLSQQMPEIMEGFGFKMDIWSYGLIYVGYKNRKFIWHSASIPAGAEELDEDGIPPVPADIENMFFHRQWMNA